LIAWQKAMALVDTVYALTDLWPQREQYILTQQVLRAVISVPSNIAEGNGRAGAREFRHHVSIANCSLCELETQLFIAHNRSYLSGEALNEALEQCDEVGRILRGLLRSLAE
jgi:four helix bundle protein